MKKIIAMLVFACVAGSMIAQTNPQQTAPQAKTEKEKDKDKDHHHRHHHHHEHKADDKK